MLHVFVLLHARGQTCSRFVCPLFINQEPTINEYVERQRYNLNLHIVHVPMLPDVNV